MLKVCSVRVYSQLQNFGTKILLLSLLYIWFKVVLLVLNMVYIPSAY